MNCIEWEEQIALLAGGELTEAEAGLVESHLAECAGCNVLLSDLRANLELLSEVHAEPVDSSHFAAVRARVLSELERQQRPWWRQVWIHGLALGALVLLLALWPRPVKQIAAVPVPAVATAPPQPKAPAAQVEPAKPPDQGQIPIHRRSRPASQMVAVKAEKPAEPVVMKLITDDPQVIIYWITDTKGD